MILDTIILREACRPKDLAASFAFAFSRESDSGQILLSQTNAARRCPLHQNDRNQFPSFAGMTSPTRPVAESSAAHRSSFA
jgi:hypothetical protein